MRARVLSRVCFKINVYLPVNFKFTVLEFCTQVTLVMHNMGYFLNGLFVTLMY